MFSDGEIRIPTVEESNDLNVDPISPTNISSQKYGFQPNGEFLIQDYEEEYSQTQISNYEIKNSHSRNISDQIFTKATSFDESFLKANIGCNTNKTGSDAEPPKPSHPHNFDHYERRIVPTILVDNPDSHTRVTAFCCANSYKLREIQKSLLEIMAGKHISDNVDLIQFSEEDNNTISSPKHPKTECFVFDYGVVVTWGMSESEELVFLRMISRFAVDMVDAENQQKEEFSVCYKEGSKPRISNDIIEMNGSQGFGARIAISHAIAQSSKLSLFEELVEVTIDQTKHIPESFAEHGIVNLSRKAIAKKIGKLFIMRVNVNLVSNILDTPEIFWDEPNLQPVYNEFKSYLEIPQRIELLNHRVSVIGNLLEMLRDNLNGSQGEFLEWIVIILIVVDIVVMSVETFLFYLQG
ncbi:hypothetical protein BB559_001018 [Furculomyces boomerangus]|uniref:DUF155 domain-containing protein n=1 Tax=Furculomyces boomerangus TaxID=61424 RepID=A0A2T9Z3E8_9FUNG|nr:hypothetical protein BB559_001018 [Furculomyces boomerangus]